MKDEAKVLIGIVAASVLIIGGGIFFLGRSGPSTTSSEKVDSTLLVKENSHTRGNLQAKVTVVEFGDYQCPACAAAYPIVEQLVKDESERIKFVFRHFPLSQHFNAAAVAEVSEAAGAQGKFWEMYGLLYEKQEEWGESDKAMDFFAEYAKQLKLDVDKFTQDIKSHAFADVVTNDQKDGVSAGVNSTPTFFINGRKFSGVLNYSDFKSKIEEELVGK